MSQLLKNACVGEGAARLDRTRRLVTGGTGFLGSHFLARVLAGAERTIALARARNPAEAEARLWSAVQGAASACSYSVDAAFWQERVSVVVGDICQEGSGLSEEIVSRLENEGVDEIWHFAANLHFELRSKGAIFSHNVAGTNNVVELAKRLGCQRFVYISTAYSAGTAFGLVREELHDVAGPFNNLYEESKCLAEHNVVNACARHGIEWRILRPSIVVGPLATLKTGGSRTGLYGLAGEIFRLRGQLQRFGQALTVDGDPATPLNLVPIDLVIQDLLHLAKTGFADVGPILHLTTKHGIDVQSGGDVIARHAGTPRFNIVPSAETKRTPIELMFGRRTRFYGAYLKGVKTFIRSLPEHPDVTPEQLDGYVREFYEELLVSKTSSEGRADCFESTTLTSFDGTPLRAYSLGDPSLPTAILVNAYGMPVDFMQPLAKALRAQFRVLSWESRGVPDLATPFDAHSAGVGDHMQDLGAVLDAHGVAAAHVVGWCTGAQIALRFASTCPERVNRLALLNGCFRLPASIKVTEYRELIREVMVEIATCPDLARSYYELIYGKNAARAANGKRKDSGTVSALLDYTEPELLHMTSVPFQSPEALYRYATMVARFQDEPEHAWAVGVTAPTLLVTGDNDVIAHPDETVEVARRIATSELLVVPGGSHFSMYYEPTVIEKTRSFLERKTDATRN